MKRPFATLECPFVGTRRSFLLRLFAVLFVLTTPTGAFAKTPICSIETVLSEFTAGLKQYKKKKHAKAVAHWQPLADLGFPPAQGRIAWMVGNGFGLKADLGRATFWAWRGAGNGDAGSMRLLRRLKRKLDKADYDRSVAGAKSWRPDYPECWNGKPKGILNKTGRRVRVGKFLIEVDDRIPDKLVDTFSGNIQAIIKIANRNIFQAPVFLSIVDVFKIIPGDQYLRYVGWKGDEPRNVLLVSTGNFLDKDPMILAMAVTLEAIRRVYSKTPEAYLVDDFVRKHKNKRIYGSNHPDVDNKLFYEKVSKMFEMAEKLPKKVFDNLDIIDEIRYNPILRKFNKLGTVDSSIAHYNPELSSEGNRIIIVRQDMKWSSAFRLLLTLARGGAYARQDQTAERYERALPKKQKTLKRLAASGKGQGCSTLIT